MHSKRRTQPLKQNRLSYGTQGQKLLSRLIRRNVNLTLEFLVVVSVNIVSKVILPHSGDYACHKNRFKTSIAGVCKATFIRLLRFAIQPVLMQKTTTATVTTLICRKVLANLPVLLASIPARGIICVGIMKSLMLYRKMVVHLHPIAMVLRSLMKSNCATRWIRNEIATFRYKMKHVPSVKLWTA